MESFLQDSKSESEKHFESVKLNMRSLHEDIADLKLKSEVIDNELLNKTNGLNQRGQSMQDEVNFKTAYITELLVLVIQSHGTYFQARKQHG